MKEVVVCIPVYNSEATLSETLDSLLNQSYKISKIKIFDNASTDKSVELVSKYILKYSHIELFKSPVNIGGEANFTKCIKASEGDFTLVAHADDIYTQDFILKNVTALDSTPEALAVITPANFIDEKSNFTDLRFYPKELLLEKFAVLNFKELFNLILTYANFITCPGVFVRSEVYRDKITFWNGEKFKTSADLDVWLRISEFGTIISLNERLINYRASDASYSFRIAKKRITKHDMFKVLDFYTKKYPSLMTDENKLAFNFLIIKDQALVTLNKMRQRMPLLSSDHFDIGIGQCFWALNKSSWHRKFLLSIIMIKFVSKFYRIFASAKHEN